MPRIPFIGAYVLPCVLLGAVAGGVVGSTRPTDYTAKATLTVAGGGLQNSLTPGDISLALSRLVEPARQPSGAGGVFETVPTTDLAVRIYRLAKLDMIAQLSAERSDSRYTAD